MSGHNERGDHETTRINPPADSAPTQAFPIVRPAAPYAMANGSPVALPATPPSIPPAGSSDGSGTAQSWWKQPKHLLIAVIAVLVVIALIATPIIINRRAKHAEALSACQSALADYQNARDRLRALSASDANAQSGTSVTCNSHDSTDTLTSSASVLRDAARTFEAEATTLEQQRKEDNQQSDSSNGSSDSDSQSSAAARKALQDSLDAANALIDKVQASIADGTAKQLMVGTLTAAANSAQKLLNDSGITDSKYYKAAKATLDEAINAVNDWVDKQASKAQ
ncbi:M-like protein Szp3 [Bifidobacterium goeldii]|uniref:M-like protein Szp3 n=1 Tax=Bifidobacterium goeldii TaxID=2306975 RepID=A0A430FD97_9BIFI|nr:hypothetical protein [Bifidobacterium goeldii]RSX50823.1 M-like protein Szp3 [Bifidobacterium goeldii]